MNILIGTYLMLLFMNVVELEFVVVFGRSIIGDLAMCAHYDAQLEETQI